MKKIVRALCYPKAHLRLSALEVTFQNKVVVITGASRGIGAAMARLLMPYKVHFIFLARTEEDLDALAEEVHREGSKADCYTIDFRNAEALAELMFRLKTRYPRVDYLFANAGKSICRSLSASQDRLHDFDRTMAVNYRSMVSLVQTLLPALMASKGRLIYTSSVFALSTGSVLGGLPCIQGSGGSVASYRSAGVVGFGRSYSHRIYATRAYLDGGCQSSLCPLDGVFCR